MWVQGAVAKKAGAAEGGEQTQNQSEKPLRPKFDASGYNKDLVESLERDIIQSNPNVHW